MAMKATGLQTGAGVEREFDVALSGGGFRSALFGLGALYYLSESKNIRRLRSIVSVSGGSYVNAKAFLYPSDLREISGAGFREHFGPMVDRISKRSVWRPFLAVAAVALAAIVAIWFNVRTGLRGWAIFALGLAVFVGAPAWGRLIAWSIWRTLFPDHKTSPPLGAKIGSIDDATGRVRRARTVQRNEDPQNDLDPSVHHVICAADLHYTGFVYLSNHLVFNERLGLGSPGHFTVKRAVDASTAIPFIFAAVPLRTRPGFLQPPGDAPALLLTADGGVNDTLATEWFIEARSLPAVRRFLERHPDDRVKALYRHAPVEPHVLVVDGSTPVQPQDHIPWTTAPLFRKRVPVLWWIVAHIRSAVIAFTNWDRRNRENLMNDPTNGLVPISVHESPFDLIDRLAEASGNEKIRDEQQSRLLEHGTDWGRIVRSNTDTPTRPKKLKATHARELMYHGYAMAWAVFTANENEPPGALTPFEDFFEGWPTP